LIGGEGILANEGDEPQRLECANRGFDQRHAARRHCGMTAIPVSKRGTVTLPPEVRRKLGLETEIDHILSPFKSRP
jgi:hypothetical protein